MKKRENFPPKKLGDFFRGGSYTGGRVWGRFWGGTFGGNAKKGVEKLFWGSVGGAVNPKKF